jgi:hypothetical protein
VKHRCQSTPDALVALGPLAQVILTPPLTHASQFDQATNKVTVQLMVDTGAQRTVIDRAIADQLGLRPIRFEQMVGVSNIPEDCPVYLMSVSIGVGDGVATRLVSFTSEFIGMSTPAVARPHSGLLGRDFLRFMRVVYDGAGGWVEIHENAPALLGQAQPATHGGQPSRQEKNKRKSQRKSRRKNRGR